MTSAEQPGEADWTRSGLPARPVPLRSYEENLTRKKRKVKREKSLTSSGTMPCSFPMHQLKTRRLLLRSSSNTVATVPVRRRRSPRPCTMPILQTKQKQKKSQNLSPPRIDECLTDD